MLPIGLEQSVHRIEFAGLRIRAHGAYASSHAISQWWLPKIPLPAGTSFILHCTCSFLEARSIVCIGHMSWAINIF